MNDYSDIIFMNRPVSKNHPPMSRESRAAQFAAFAALTGYGEKVDNQDNIDLNRDDSENEVFYD